MKCKSIFIYLASFVVQRHYFQEDLTFEKCSRYSVNWTDLIEANALNEFNHSGNWPVEPCVEGYEYDTSVVPSSIVIDVSYWNYLSYKN